MRKVISGFMLFAVAAVCFTSWLKAAETGDRLLRAIKQIEVQYQLPAQVGLKPEQAHIEYLEKTLAAIQRSSAAIDLHGEWGVSGQLRFVWFNTTSGWVSPQLYIVFIASVSADGIVEDIRFTSDNLSEWRAQMEKQVDAHRRSVSTETAIKSAIAALKKRGFADIVPVPVISWDEGAVTGLAPQSWSGFALSVASPDSKRAKIGLAAANAADKTAPIKSLRHFFTIELDNYSSADSKWGRASVIVEEVWDGFKPLGNLTARSTDVYALW